MKLSPRVCISIESKYTEQLVAENLVLLPNSDSSKGKLSNDFRQSVNYLVNALLMNYVSKTNQGIETRLLDEAFLIVQSPNSIGLKKGLTYLPESHPVGAANSGEEQRDSNFNPKNESDDIYEFDESDESDDIEIDKSLSLLPSP